MLAAIKAFFVALPVVMDLVKTLLQKWNDLIDLQKENALKERELLASRKAVETKDTSDLENIYRGKP